MHVKNRKKAAEKQRKHEVRLRKLLQLFLAERDSGKREILSAKLLTLMKRERKPVMPRSGPCVKWAGLVGTSVYLLLFST
jgi:hypothetical protein